MHLIICTGLLLRFASSSNSELCAIAAARLHALIQFKSHPDSNEVAYLIFNINSSLLAVQGKTNTKIYVFIAIFMRDFKNCLKVGKIAPTAMLALYRS